MPAAAGDGRPEGLGPVPSLRRLQGPGRHREPRLRCPAPEGLRRLDHGRGRAPRRRARHAPPAARPVARGVSALCSGERFAPEPLTPMRRERLEKADLSAAPARSRRFRIGSSRLSSAFSATISFPKCRRSPPGRRLDLRVNTLKVLPRGGARCPAAASQCRRDAALALGPSHRAERGRARTCRAVGARVPEGLDRDPGRGLAARGAALRRQARRAGGRSLRGRRRQDAGARRADGEPRPDLRHCDSPAVSPRSTTA